MKHQIFALVLAAGLTGPALAEQVRDKAVIERSMPAALLNAQGSEPIAIVISDGGATVWTGTLKMGRTYGSASFSQSRNEAEDPCPGEAKNNSTNPTSSSSLNFSISRYNWQQEPDAFSISLNWSRPIPVCQGQGNNSYGINRNITLAQGQTVTIEGTGGVSIRLTRAR